MCTSSSLTKILGFFAAVMKTRLKFVNKGGQYSKMVSFLASRSSCLGFDSQHSIKVQGKKLLIFVRLINGAG